MNRYFSLTPFVTMMIILLVVGTISGLALSRMDLLNPETSRANANNIDIKTAHEEAIYRQEERRDEAKTNAYIIATQIQSETASALAEINIQFQNQISIIAINLFSVFAFVTQFLVIGLGSVLVLSISICIINYAIRITEKSFAPKHQKIVKPIIPNLTVDLWQYRDYRRAKIAEARLNEQKAREDAIEKERVYETSNQKPVTWQDLLLRRDYNDKKNNRQKE